MKYTYAYKTSDGTRHEASMEAKSREEVFATLRAQGIKAIKVVAADGSKANGAPSPDARRTPRAARGTLIVLGAVCLVLFAITASIISFRAGEKSNNPTIQQSNNSFLTDTTRRQVIGDAAIIETGIRTGWADVFEHEGDRFLASFAIPGVKAGVGTTSVAALEDVLAAKSNNQPIKRSNNPSLEAQQIVAMVEGMKREARAYIAAGGTAVEYGRRLTERQDAEIAIYRRVEAEILAAYAQLNRHKAQGGAAEARGTPHEARRTSMSEDAFTRLYERRNDELRNLGIRPVTLPE